MYTTQHDLNHNNQNVLCINTVHQGLLRTYSTLFLEWRTIIVTTYLSTVAHFIRAVSSLDVSVYLMITVVGDTRLLIGKVGFVLCMIFCQSNFSRMQPECHCHWFFFLYAGGFKGTAVDLEERMDETCTNFHKPCLRPPEEQYQGGSQGSFDVKVDRSC